MTSLRRSSTPRLIPAYAGSTGLVRTLGADPAAHPRLRGEHSACSRIVRNSAGSSPLTRGALARCSPRRCRGRLIPAYAGSTTWSGMISSSVRAHPRLRGEHEGSIRQYLRAGGSSPLTRGALASAHDRREARWLIPAYAGSTHSGAPVSRA